MSKILVSYFSASGVTRKLAEKIAKVANADLYEIEPAELYTRADLDWMNKKSRSSLEMNDKTIRPAMIKKDLDIAAYDKIFIGFPIWWYVAPTIINTFLETYDFADKEVILFATSGGSGFGNTVSELQLSAPQAHIAEGRLLNRASDSAIAEFVKEYV